MKPTYEELEKKCALQQSKLAAINELMGVVEKASDIAKVGIEELQSQNADLAVQLANAESKCRELAAESVTVKECASDVMRHVYRSKTYLDSSRVVDAIQGLQCAIERKAGKAPATDAFLAEVRASARNEGINYTASRLAAAFNHGFVDKPLAEVCDVVRMILDTKEELANSTLPAVDGISGEYAEKFLAEFAAQLRKGDKS